MRAALEFFAAQGPVTSPGDWASLFGGLPDDVPSLCRIVQGLMIHVFWAQRYGVELAEPRRRELQLRTVAQKLGRIMELDRRPLAEAREPERRLVGNCRDFSVMLASLLRYHGVAARARCGFARYFVPDRFEDHWVCEYWNAGQGRWVLVDAQLDELQCSKLALRFDPLDVPRDQFLVAGEAWQLCRSGRADPDRFGIFEMRGLWFVRGDLVRDVASLNKIELLPWDCWGLIEARDDALSADDLALLDRAAGLASTDVPHFGDLRLLYQSDQRLRVPSRVRSYTGAGATEEELAFLRAG